MVTIAEVVTVADVLRQIGHDERCHLSPSLSVPPASKRLPTSSSAQVMSYTSRGLSMGRGPESLVPADCVAVLADVSGGSCASRRKRTSMPGRT